MNEDLINSCCGPVPGDDPFPKLKLRHDVPAVDLDRLFLRRRPHRKHRIRLASRQEIAENAELGLPAECPDGLRRLVALREIGGGNRMRVKFRDTADRETDLREADAKAMFTWIVAISDHRVRAINVNVGAAA